MSACCAVRVRRPRRRSLDLVRWWVKLLLSLVSGATVVEVGEGELRSAEWLTMGEMGLASAAPVDSMGKEGEVGVVVMRN